MLPEGWANLVALMDGEPDPDPLTRTQRLCGLCLTATAVEGVALGISTNGHRSTVWATDAVSDRLEDLQVEFSEGPCFEALRDGWPVLVADLVTGTEHRWPWFTPAAVETGARAFFVIPLQVGAIRLGVLSLYRTRAGELDPEQFRDALVLAEAASLLLTLRDTQHTAEAFVWAVGDRSRFHAEVHQAVGVLIVQLDLDARDAFARLCAHAYVTGRPIGDVAVDLVAGRLRLERN